MKQQLTKWAFRITVTSLVCLGFIVGIVLNPAILYANKTLLGNFTIYHQQPLDKELIHRLDDANEILKTSEYYDASIKFDICMNDGSLYPELMQLFLGRAFALGYTSNKVTLCGDVYIKENYVQVNDCKWNLTQLLAHEQTHCVVYHKLGFWQSNPIANHALWKWEGYPEYVSRRATDQTNLATNIEILNQAIKKDKDAWGISFDDSTLSPQDYFHYRLLVQYCLEIKKMNYQSLLSDTTGEKTIATQMMTWYATQKGN